MKIILFAIFNLIGLNIISSKNLKSTDIFKGDYYSEKMFHTNNITISNNSAIENFLKIKIFLKKPKDTGIDTKLIKNKILNDMDRILNTNKRSKKDEKINFYLACCSRGGLTSDNEFLNAYKWAVKNNYINISCNDFAQKVSKEFKTAYHKDWKIQGPSCKGNFRVLDSKLNIIFDSAKF